MSTSPPPGVPPQAPNGTGQIQPRESRSVAFFVAIFLGILLVASAALNVLLLLLSVGSLAGGSLGLGGDPDGGIFDEVYVAGQRGGRTKVLQVPIRGAISEASNLVLGASGGTVTQVERALRRAAGDGVAGVVLYIDSPGGGVTDSDAIYEAVGRFRQQHPEKKVAALFGDLAASGGYYVGVAAERIFARRTTITGSIGVIMSAWNFAAAAERLGVEQIAIKSERTPFKDTLSPTRPMRDDERRLLTRIVDELYDRFLEVVAAGRSGLDRQAIETAANGAIYTAPQALGLGLIDEIGDHRNVVDWFERQLGRPVTIVEFRRRLGLGDLLFGAAAAAPPADALGQLLHSTTGPRFLYFWTGGR